MDTTTELQFTLAFLEKHATEVANQQWEILASAWYVYADYYDTYYPWYFVLDVLVK